MSRYAQGGGNNLVAANALQQVAAKENNYKEPIKVNHGLCKSAANRIAQLERELLQNLGDGDSESSSIISREELAQILNEHKETLKEIAARNVDRERTVEAFVRGVHAVRLELSSNNNHDNNNDNNDNNNQGEQNDDPTNNNLPDYNAKIKDAAAQYKNAQPYLPVHQEPLYREVAEALGEKKLTATTTGGNNQTHGGDDDDDIEIEIQETQGGATQANLNHLKCPITGRLLERPVRNKVCKHVYSHEGILAHIRAKTSRHRNATCPCPVGGCANHNVTAQQLEKDVETDMLVKRRKRHDDKLRERQEQAQAAADDDLMDSEEE